MFERVPPELYGGTERVVSYLTEGLVELGHDVTLFASGDSLTHARLVPVTARALRLSDRMAQAGALHERMLRAVYTHREEFDVVHFHVDDWQLLEPRLLAVPHVTTVHGRIDTPDRRGVYERSPELRLVSISHAQRRPVPDARWLATVYHGIPGCSYTERYDTGRYLAFVGRISVEKRVDRAIEIARRVGLPLKVAAKLDELNPDYVASIEPALRSPWVDFVGEVDERGKDELLGGAHALLFPIEWPEPFGLAMVEAMVCGTPVIAWRRGSVPEIVDEGITGFTVDSIEEAVCAVARAADLDRARCAAHARKRFCSERMVRDYVRVYERRRWQHRAELRDASGRRGERGHARPGQ